MADQRNLARLGDKTTRGHIVSASSTILDDHKALVVNGDLAWCDICRNSFQIIATYTGWVENGFLVGDGDKVLCNCKDNYVIATSGYVGERQSKVTSPPEPAQNGQLTKKKFTLPSYLTGEKQNSGFVPDYPLLRNTRDLPDAKIRDLLRDNNNDVMFLTAEEAYEVLADWEKFKKGWISLTDNTAGQIIVSYGTNLKDVVTTSKLVIDLGDLGIQATTYINHKGTELIKLTGYPGIRKVLNAPVFAAKNPKVVDLGIGKYGLNNSIVQGARLTFYVAAAFRTVDYILNDETSLNEFIGGLATDAVKVGISSFIAWGAGIGVGALTGLVAVNLVVVVGVGLIATIGLNYLDEKFGFTDKLVEYIEAAQQEFIEKARELGSDMWDIGAMYVDNALRKGRVVVEYEIQKYSRQKISELMKVDWK